MNFLKKLATWQLVLAAIVLAGSISFGVTYATADRQDVAASTCKGNCVSLADTGASPSTIAVPLNSFVQFNSADGKTYDLSLGGGGSEHEHKGKFQSGDFGKGEAWRVQFKDEGSFIFHDHHNPKVSVLVIVYEPGKQYKVE